MFYYHRHRDLMLDGGAAQASYEPRMLMRDGCAAQASYSLLS